MSSAVVDARRIAERSNQELRELLHLRTRRAGASPTSGEQLADELWCVLCHARMPRLEGLVAVAHGLLDGWDLLHPLDHPVQLADEQRERRAHLRELVRRLEADDRVGEGFDVGDDARVGGALLPAHQRALVRDPTRQRTGRGADGGGSLHGVRERDRAFSAAAAAVVFFSRTLFEVKVS